MPLAAHACRPETSLGRALAEPGDGLRGPYQRDRDRIVHATAFRRLEGKTQVLLAFEGDHFRTRLTHSLEVAQVARTLARALAVDEDLAEAVALGHDLGHSPFGHAGERGLAASLAAFGGFDHNLQTFRIVTRLERRYAAFDGLNLTFETLEGLVKHNGPVADLAPPIAQHPLPARIDLALQPPVEAQVAAIADDVAYCSHDVDDGLRAGFFALAELADVPLAGEALTVLRAEAPGLDPDRAACELGRRLIGRLVLDIVAESRARLAASAPGSVAAVRALPAPVVGFSRDLVPALDGLRRFLRERMYRHYKINRMSLKAKRLVNEIVGVLLEAPGCLPGRWRDAAGEPGSARTAGVVRDYVAGMTDRFALDEHDRLFRLGRERA